MRKQIRSISVIAFLGFGSFQNIWGGPPVTVEPVPQYLNIVEKDSISDVYPGWIQVMTWPSEAHLYANRAKPNEGQVPEAIKSTHIWLRRILLPQWVPEDDQVEMIPLRHEIDGRDIIRLRYRIGDYVFQVASTSCTIWITVGQYGKTATNILVGVDDGQKYFLETSAKFFLKADEFGKKYKFNPVKRKSGVTSINQDPSSNWWETINWWTDGNALMVLSRKDESLLKQGPSTDPEWFGLR